MEEQYLKNQNRKSGFWSRVFNPFQYIAGLKALLWGLVAIVISSVVASMSGTHFDGVVDVHRGAPTSLTMSLAESFTDWLTISLVLYMASLITSKSSVRPVDIFGTLALSRAPMIIPALAGFMVEAPKIEAYIKWKFLQNGNPVALTNRDLVLFIIASLLDILAIIWMIALMYNAWKVSANLKGGRAIWSFIVGLLVAIVLAELAMHYGIDKFRPAG